MISATLLYPKTTDSRFDLDYYLKTHTPLVHQHLDPAGLVSIDLKAGLAGGGPDTPPAYAMITQLNFNSLEDLQAALAAHAPVLLADIPSFTNVQPVIQISQSI
ncbi:hypothetical protein GCM10028807_50390 [Spirosoma daeguense]